MELEETKDATDNNESKLIVDIPHIEQHYSWDCGIASTCMVLRYLGIDDSDIYQRLDEVGCSNSIWTIDLAYILQLYNIPTSFRTVTLGVDPGYAKQTFYKSNYNRDETRVKDLIENAEENGINVEKRSVAIHEIVNHLRKKKPVICLTDWAYLDCLWCKNIVVPCFKFTCRTCCNQYEGHFVVICGFDMKKKHIFYKNPALKDELCCSKISRFDKARKSYGTDEDLLFINVTKEEITGS